MSKKNQKKKSRKQKSRKSLAIGEEYVIRYCSGERLVVLLICIFYCMVGIAVIVCFLITDADFRSIFFLLPAVPLVLGSVFVYRFRIQFRANQKELEVRKLFRKSQKISLEEIQEIYYSTDSRVNFLNIITESVKIHVNKAACENVQFLEVFLRTYCKYKFKTRIRKEVHLL
ncbi:MAG: hypothetical protein K2H29_09115 [Oscillospiraceae bacterium]|nr:hypothetical protein [Oscillospiraceae bacterium]